MSEFQNGMTVQLKSGGPLMTVQQPTGSTPYGFEPDRDVRCIWFDGPKLESRYFQKQALKLAE